MFRSRHVHRALLGALVGLSGLSSAGAARGDEAMGESAAERLFLEGRALMIEGRFADACPKLEESQRLDPRGGTLLNVAVCHERLGKIAAAWGEFRDALATARAEGQPKRERLAEERLSAIEPRLPWLLVSVTPGGRAGDLTVAIDGATIPPIAWGKEMPVDPGEHRVTASAGGRQFFHTTVVLMESAHETVTVPEAALIEPKEAPKVPAAKAPPLPAQAKAKASPSAPGQTPHPAGRFVYEIGVFGGYMTGDMDRARPFDDPESVRFLVQEQNGDLRFSSCAALYCSYALPSLGGFVAGPTAFAGYALTERVHVGLRALVGPRAGGGALFAIGPSASARLWGRLWVGGSLLVGTASESGRGYVDLEQPSSSTAVRVVDFEHLDFRTRLSESVGFALGAGAEIGVALTDSPKGSFMLQTTPLFLVGPTGSALTLPLSVVHRWH
jgi:hypothetical protein